MTTGALEARQLRGVVHWRLGNPKHPGVPSTCGGDAPGSGNPCVNLWNFQLEIQALAYTSRQQFVNGCSFAKSGATCFAGFGIGHRVALQIRLPLKVPGSSLLGVGACRLVSFFIGSFCRFQLASRPSP